MDPFSLKRWQLIDDLFDQALDRPAADRAAYLEAACGDDAALLEAVRALVDSAQTAEQVIGERATAFAGDVLATMAPGIGDTDIEPGTLIGHYRVLRELGRGGMGAVYLAERADGEFHKRVAIKLVKRGMDTDEILRRFRAERNILAALEHPQIARLYDGGVSDDGRPYLVMELVEGEPITTYCATRQLDVDARLQLFRKVCEAVQYAHDNRVIHRDVKPSNILVGADGLPKLLDFGIARLLADDNTSPQTRSTVRILTPEYASPEQLRGEATGLATDVYALGVVLYELLTGKRRDAAAGASRPRAAVADKTLRRRLTGDLDRITLKALAVDPSQRYASARALGDDVGRHLAGLPIHARPASPGYRLARYARRHRAIGGGAAIALLGMLAAAAAIGGNRGAITDRETRPRLAILQMDDLAGDGADAYLAEGLTDEIAVRLGSLDRLRVLSPRATQQVPNVGAGASPQAVGAALRVDYLVEGSLRRHTDQMRLALRLTRTADGFVVWSENYDVAGADLLQVQETIAREIAGRIAGRLVPEERVALGRRPTAVPQAYDHLLRGNYLLRRRTPERVLQAIEQYRLATQLDSAFSLARAREAYAYALFVDWGWTFPGATSEELLARGLIITERILQRDLAVADAWMARGYLFVLRDPLRHQGAVEAFERAIALDPTNAEALHQLGQSLMVLGRYEDARTAYQRALEIEPYRAMTYVAMAAVAQRTGRPQEANILSDSAIAVDSLVPYAFTARALRRLKAGDADGARRDAAAAIQLDSSYSLPARSVLAAALHQMGDVAAARRQLRIAELLLADAPRPTPTEALFLGSAFMIVDREADALRLLEHTRPRGAWVWFYFQDPLFDGIRSHDRFRQVMRQVQPASAQ